MEHFILFAGTANPGLAKAIARQLNISLGECVSERFPDGEVAVRLLESVRQKSVFLIQSTSPPVNDRLVELLAFADACRRAAAARITAIIPYFGYARSDKRHGRREPIAASMVAEVLEAVGIDRVVTLDLHAPQIEGFFRIPVDSLTAVPTLCEALRDRLPPDVVVVSPDTGRVQMATQYAQKLDTSAVVLHKQRKSGTETEVTRIVGDVGDRPCLIIDDMISTGGTLARSIEALLNAGARPDITIAATHGLFIAGARAKLSHPSIQAIFVTDTIATQETDWQQLQVVSIAPLIAKAIQWFVFDGSLGDLF
ncbi:ribose-phosphate diphosphokinase [Chroococcidiopsis sp.]|uniref:ribose-phosphate diphosphokinase n=1 Tax=Chroococcidiopsis sp. TaxID=3088168 RepID=UPI003F2DCD59